MNQDFIASENFPSQMFEYYDSMKKYSETESFYTYWEKSVCASQHKKSQNSCISIYNEVASEPNESEVEDCPEIPHKIELKNSIFLEDSQIMSVDKILKRRKKKDNTQDIVRKSSIRMVKRFFHRIFMEENKKMAKRRFVNVKFTEVLNAFKKMIRKYLRIENSERLALFLLRLLSINPKRDPNTNSEAEKNA